jgi:hypothetical protein
LKDANSPLFSLPPSLLPIVFSQLRKSSLLPPLIGLYSLFGVFKSRHRIELRPPFGTAIPDAKEEIALQLGLIEFQGSLDKCCAAGTLGRKEFGYDGLLDR